MDHPIAVQAIRNGVPGPKIKQLYDALKQPTTIEADLVIVVGAAEDPEWEALGRKMGIFN